MRIAIDKLAISVFKKPLDECGLDELRQPGKQYPYFAPLQLLAAKKLKTKNSDLFKDQIQKTSLYFPNRLWLERLLNESESKLQVIADTQGDSEEKELAGYEDLNKTEQLIEATLEDQPEEVKITDETTIAENAEQTESQPSFEIPALKKSVELTSEEPPEEVEIIYDTSITENTDQTGSQPTFEIPTLKIEPLNAVDTEFAFQPYHTVDYFASQGVKFREDEKPKDRFGQQLKSFTEWLKTMKRLPVSEIIPANDTNVEQKVEQLAEHSIADRDIVTEAMAEVWEKQGNYTKAEEIYRKLSLLDPPKSSYFAAKIDQIKKT